jgi:hypothetical protein
MPDTRHDDDTRQPMPLALRPKAAAAALGISVSTLERGRRAGYIKAAKFGRCTVYAWADLAAALEDAKQRGDLLDDYTDPRKADDEGIDDDDEKLAAIVASLKRGTPELDKLIAELRAEQAAAGTRGADAVMRKRLKAARV